MVRLFVVVAAAVVAVAFAGETAADTAAGFVFDITGPTFIIITFIVTAVVFTAVVVSARPDVRVG